MVVNFKVLNARDTELGDMRWLNRGGWRFDHVRYNFGYAQIVE